MSYNKTISDEDKKKNQRGECMIDDPRKQNAMLGGSSKFKISEL